MTVVRSGEGASCGEPASPRPSRRRKATVTIIIVIVLLDLPHSQTMDSYLRMMLTASAIVLAFELARELIAGGPQIVRAGLRDAWWAFVSVCGRVARFRLA